MFGFNAFASDPFAGLSSENKAVTGTLAVTLDDVIVSASGVNTHKGTLALTLDDIQFNATGAETHQGTLAVTLDDVIVVMTGKDVHAGYLSLTLDDAVFSASGAINHQGTLALVLDDVVIHMSGAGSETGTLSLTTDDVAIAFNGTVIHPDVQVVTKGGLPKKKIKKEREEVENAVSKAVNKALGIVEPEDIAEEAVEQKAPEIDYTAQLNNMILQMQAEALGLSIEQYLIESELDDEEAILLFL